jgi:hypothetical protein
MCYLEREGALNLSALNVLDHKVCARSHATTPISHGVAKNAMAKGNARITRVRGYTQSQPMRSIVACSILVVTQIIN